MSLSTAATYSALMPPFFRFIINSLKSASTAAASPTGINLIGIRAGLLSIFDPVEPRSTGAF